MPSIAVVTPLFPIPQEPYRSKAIYRTVLSLQRYGRVAVYCPLAVYPRFTKKWYRKSGVNAGWSPPGIEEVHYFEYAAFPFMSRSLNGEFCTRTLRPYLEKTQHDIVLSFWVYPEGYASVKAAHQLGIPVIVGARGSDLRRIEDPLSLILSRRHCGKRIRC